MPDIDKATDDGGQEKSADELGADNPTSESKDAMAKPTTIDLSSLRYEMTEEETAEEKRRYEEALVRRTERLKRLRASHR